MGGVRGARSSWRTAIRAPTSEGCVATNGGTWPARKRFRGVKRIRVGGQRPHGEGRELARSISTSPSGHTINLWRRFTHEFHSSDGPRAFRAYGPGPPLPHDHLDGAGHPPCPGSPL